MRASASVVWIAGLAVAFIAVASCGGKVIRLGNATTGTGGGSATGMDGGGGADGGGTCQHGLVKANEVLFVGDSWVRIPGTQPLDTRVRDLARAAGAIGPTEDYVDLAAGGTTIATIASQYNTQEAGATKVKVLVMDGGGWDTILAGGSDASVTGVVNTFTQHLAKVASDGTVQHIVYFLYPELPDHLGSGRLAAGRAAGVRG